MTIYGRTIPTHQINLQRGNAETIQFTLLSGGSAIDLTGKTLVFRARRGSYVLRKLTADGITVAAPETGVAVMALSATETRALPVNEPVAFELENYTDQVTLMQGTLVGAGGVNDD